MDRRISRGGSHPCWWVLLLWRVALQHRAPQLPRIREARTARPGLPALSRSLCGWSRCSSLQRACARPRRPSPQRSVYSTQALSASTTRPSSILISPRNCRSSIPTRGVFPDGRMETTYRLKPDLTWHDGAPLTPMISPSPSRCIRLPSSPSPPPRPRADRVNRGPDPRTLSSAGSRPSPMPTSLTSTQPGDSDSPRRLNALPRHILPDALERGDTESLSPTRTGLRSSSVPGPWRLTRWEPGAFIEGEAFAGHALGRPKIDRIRIIFTPDPNAALANMLSGALTSRPTIRCGSSRPRSSNASGPEQARNGAEELRPAPSSRDPDATRSRQSLDPARHPVRRALAYAMDREALNNALVDGSGKLANTLITPDHGLFCRGRSLVTRDPYDPCGPRSP